MQEPQKVVNRFGISSHMHDDITITTPVREMPDLEDMEES